MEYAQGAIEKESTRSKFQEFVKAAGIERDVCPEDGFDFNGFLEELAMRNARRFERWCMAPLARKSK